MPDMTAGEAIDPGQNINMTEDVRDVISRKVPERLESVCADVNINGGQHTGSHRQLFPHMPINFHP